MKDRSSIIEELQQRFGAATLTPQTTRDGVPTLWASAVVPFHMRTPDVYEGAPAPVTAFVATVPWSNGRSQVCSSRSEASATLHPRHDRQSAGSWGSVPLSNAATVDEAA
jgi:Proton-conducting membrane transporter